MCMDDDTCEFWHFEEGTYADQGRHQRLNPYTRCGTCTTCRADIPDPPWLAGGVGFEDVDENGDEIVGEDESPLGGSDPACPAPHTDPWRAMAAALHRELHAARVPFTTDHSQAGHWTTVSLLGGGQVEIWYQDHTTGEDLYVVLVQPAVPGDNVWLANFAPAYASTVAQLCALFVRAGGVV